MTACGLGKTSVYFDSYATADREGVWDYESALFDYNELSIFYVPEFRDLDV